MAIDYFYTQRVVFWSARTNSLPLPSSSAPNFLHFLPLVSIHYSSNLFHPFFSPFHLLHAFLLTSGLNVIKLYEFDFLCASTRASRCFQLFPSLPFNLTVTSHNNKLFPAFKLFPHILLLLLQYAFCIFMLFCQCLQHSQKVSLYLPRPCSSLSIYDLSIHTYLHFPFTSVSFSGQK